MTPVMQGHRLSVGTSVGTKTQKNILLDAIWHSRIRTRKPCQLLYVLLLLWPSQPCQMSSERVLFHQLSGTIVHTLRTHALPVQYRTWPFPLQFLPIPRCRMLLPL